MSEWIMKVFFLLVVLSALLFHSTADNCSEHVCAYTVYVKTGSLLKAGTDSTISMTLGDPDGLSVWAVDLQNWGMMGRDHDYFERGSLDIFSGRGPCIGRPICRLNLTSDGSGAHHGWFCDYLEVTSTGPHRDCSQTVFYVDRWLVKGNLTAVLDGCDDQKGKATGRFVRRGGNGKFVLGPHPSASSA